MNELREEFFRYIEAHPAWDKRTRSLVIAEAKETSIKIRALVSAADPDKLWTLRCDVREALITYVQEQHPAHLVKTRVAVQDFPAQPLALARPALVFGHDDVTSASAGRPDIDSRRPPSAASGDTRSIKSSASDSGQPSDTQPKN